MSHGGEYRIRRSNTLMPTDQLDPIFINSISPTCQSEHRCDAVVLSGASKNPNFYGVATAAVSGRTMVAPCANPTCNCTFPLFSQWKEHVSFYGRDGDENPEPTIVERRYYKKPYEAGMKVFMLETDDVDPRSRTDPPKRRIEYNLAGRRMCRIVCLWTVLTLATEIPSSCFL
jgi:hypothetical protein